MRTLVTPEEMAAADQAAIAAGTPAAVLMERAGRAVARVAMEVAGGRYGRRALVVSGKGNNGGDGFVAARVLAREGVAVRCALVVEPDEIEGAAGEHFERLAEEGLRPRRFDPRDLAVADVIVDAIFGTGFRGRASGRAAEVISALNEAGAPVVAVDIPSGVNGTTGAVEGPAVSAAVTVALGAEKTGTATGAGAARAGHVVVADIGIEAPAGSTFLLDPSDAVLPLRPPDAHKRTSGSVALLAGSDEYRGAALLTAGGALRMGAGYVTLGTTSSVAQAAVAAMPELLVSVVSHDRVLGPDSLELFSDVLDRANVLALGPGLGRGGDQEKLVETVLEEVDLPLVIDADGLNALEGRAGLLAGRKAPTVLTPHPAELARLLGISLEEVQSDRLEAARSAAQDTDCVVLLKGFRSIVAAGGDAFVIGAGGSELATAGTGDVLTGAIAALVAAGLEPIDATTSGALVHGLAGSLAADRAAPEGVVAGDVAESLPEAIAMLRANGAAL